MSSNDGVNFDYPYQRITFTGNSGKIVGVLQWEEFDTLTFEGDADESADLLFEYVRQRFEAYITQRIQRIISPRMN